jgi:hypothetical protein
MGARFKILLILLFIIPSTAFAGDSSNDVMIRATPVPGSDQPAIEVEKKGRVEGRKIAVMVDDLPYGHHRRKGVHFKRRYRLDYFHNSMNHTLPDQYIKEVPEGKEREGLQEHIMIGFYSNFRSKYMSKEQPDSKGPVWQPSATIEAYGFGFNVWANFVLNDEANQGEFNEVDFIPYYTAHIGNLTIHPYFMFMVFPNGDPKSLDYTSEPIIEADLHVDYTLWHFNFFGLMRSQVKGTSVGSVYANVGVGYNQPFCKNLTLQTAALINMGNDIYLTSKYGQMGTNIDALAFQIALAWKAWRGLTLKPNIQATVHIVPSIRRRIDNIPNNDNEIVWGGLDVAYEF